MARLTFDDLREIYQSTTFHKTDTSTEFGGELTITTQRILDLLIRIDKEDEFARDSNIYFEAEIDILQVGDTLKITAGPPRIGLGVLAWDMDGLLLSSDAKIKKPTDYFLISDDDGVEKYLKILNLMDIFAEAVFLDREKQCLIFLEGGRINVPVDYKKSHLKSIDSNTLDRFLGFFQSDLHREERLGILARVARDMVCAQSVEARFEHLLAHIDDLATQVQNGYRLFASAFSYDRIRGKIEKETAETITRIHKTLTDIQGQMLGLPTATVIAATQMKGADECGAVATTNLAVTSGVIMFSALLLVALWNQWLTLGTIGEEVSSQKKRMHSQHKDIQEQFADLYDKADRRLCWHRSFLIALTVIAFIVTLFTVWAYYVLTTVDNIRVCLL